MEVKEERRRKLTRRGLVLGGVGAASAVAGFLEHDALKVERQKVYPADYKGPTKRIAFLTDPHISCTHDRDRALRAVDLAAAEKPDLLLLGGDYVTRRGGFREHDIHDFLVACAKVAPAAGILGNHDYGEKDWPKRFRWHFQNAGIPLLINREVEIAGLRVYGCDDALHGDPLPPPASMSTVLAQVPDLEQMQSDILLAPDVAQAAAQAKAQCNYAESVRAGQKPSVTLLMNGAQTLGTDRATEWIGGVAVNIPLYQPGADASMTAAARRYQAAYVAAIEALAGGKRAEGPEAADGISIKLSALFSRYEVLQRERVFAELQAEGRALLVATHDVAQASAWPRVLCLNHGQVAFGPPATTLTTDVLRRTYGDELVILDGAHQAVCVSHHAH